MHTTSTVHLTNAAHARISIRKAEGGARYLVLNISDHIGGVPELVIFPAGTDFLDKLANECERAVREFIGDVPAPSAAEVAR